MKAMCEYAIEAADWSTELPQLDFAVREGEIEREEKETVLGNRELHVLVL